MGDSPVKVARRPAAVRMLQPMTSTPSLHAATAAAVRSTADAYEAVARVLERRDPSASLRYLALAVSQRQRLLTAGA